MAGQSITFDFLTRGADSTASGFRKVGDNTVLAARGARVLSDAIEKLGKKEDRTAAESKILASALRQTGEAEDRVAARAVLADAAIRRLDDSMQDSAKKSGELRKALGGLKLNPGLAGPALLLAPAMTTLAGAAAGAGVALGGAFIAGGAALAAFGVVAKPVLTDAKKASDAVEKAQTAYNTAIANGVPKAKAYKAEQLAIAKAYAGMSPAQIALSKQLGDMAASWDKVKAAQTPVVAGALQPWLRSVTGLTSALGPIIAKIAPVIGSLGTKFGSLVNSSAFKGFRDFIGSTGAAAVSAGGSTIIDLIKSFMILLPKFDPLIREAIGWISRLGPAVLSWASSQKTADHITAFMQWFSQNGPVVGGLLKNIGGALKALAPGLASGGATELKIISGFLGVIAKLPPSIAKPLGEVAGTMLILSKLGVLKVGLKIIGPAAKWLSGGLINLGGGAAAGTEIRAAMVSGGAAAAAEIRAAMAGGGAAAGGGGLAGAAGSGAVAGKAAGGGFVAAFRAAISPVLGGVLVGALIRAAGDTLSPAGSFAGRLNAQFQADGHMWSTSLLHSFTFGGLEGWLTAHFGQPVGGALNNVASGAKIWGRGLVSTAGGFFSSIAHGAAIAFGHVGDSAKSGFGAAGQHADALRTRNLVPLQGEFGRVTGGIQGLAGTIQGTMLNALRAAGARSDSLRTANLLPLRGEVGRVSGGIQGLQRSINAMHGKTVNVGVHGSGSGGVSVTPSTGVPGAKNYSVFFKPLATGGLVRMGSGPTADDVPAMLSRGELVVPAHMVKAGAADNLRGKIPGFAAGGLAAAQDAIGRGGAANAAAEVRVDINAMVAAIRAAAKAAAFSAAHVPDVGSGVARWKGTVDRALRMEGLSTAFDSRVLYQMQTESGGRVNAINLTDINAQRGDPSRGLMQVIMSTFRAYHWPGTSNNIYDPLANIAAAINYARHVYGPQLGNQYGGIGSGHGYALGGLVGYASGGQVSRQGAAYLKAWRTKHGGGFGAAWGPVVVNEQIAEMAAAAGRAKALAGARGLSPGQHRFWAASAADETKRLGVLHKELTTERAWRTQLGLNELSLDKEIRAAGNLPGLRGAVRGWKAALGRDKATVTAISRMLGYSGAHIKAHPAHKPPPPGPKLPPVQHSYGGDVANNLGAVLAAALGPFTGAARGGMVMDSGGWLRPGWNPPSFNGTGRPEHLVPASGRGGGDVHLHLTVNAPVGSQQQLEDWYVKTANKLARHGRLSQAVRAASR